MNFIKLTGIEANHCSYITSETPKTTSEIIGFVYIPLNVLKNNAIIMENLDLAAPEGFYEPNKIDFVTSTSKLFVNFPGIKYGTIFVAENLKDILHQIESLKEN